MLSECVDGFQQLSTGYKKIPGNGCKGGLALDIGPQISCGPHHSSSSVLSFFSFVFKGMLWLGLACFVVFVGIRYHSHSHGQIRWVLF